MEQKPTNLASTSTQIKEYNKSSKNRRGRPSLNNSTVAIRMSECTKKELEALADKFNCTYANKPHIGSLLEKIAKGTLYIVPKKSYDKRYTLPTAELIESIRVNKKLYPDYIECNFESGYLTKINLSETNLTRANFTLGYLEFVNFENAILKEANFFRAHPKSANFRRADLTGAIMERANFQAVDGYDKHNAYLKDVSNNNSPSTFREAILKKANLRYAYLKEVDLSCADLSYADLSYADLKGANLEGANLEGADLLYADLSYADLKDANLEGANFTEAVLTGGIIKDAKNLSKAIFIGAKLDPEQKTFFNELKIIL